MDQAARTLRVLALIAAALLLSACPARAPRPYPPDDEATLPPASSPSATTAPSSPSLPPAPASPPAPPPRENHLSAATSSLVTQARSLTAHGDLDGASATLDRALRIEPSNPLLWIERGRLRLAENDAHQAESCGRKALALASGDRGTQAQAGRLIADALRAQQRNQEAAQIERQPYMQAK
jgi:tetratricopeptide (TPR) repeat protein